MRRNKRDNCVIKQWRIQGRGPGLPLFLDQTEKFFLETGPPPYLRVWMTAPPLSGTFKSRSLRL